MKTELYVDGQLEASGGAPNIGVSGGNNNLLCIGCNPDQGREWNGMIDDVAMWDRALTAAEVITIYDAGTAASPQDLGTLINSIATETDGDGLIDDWEIANLPAGAHLDNDMSDNLEDYNRRTLPQNDDTDMDGYKDGSFDDIVTDTGTDPRSDDTDGDGLKDGVDGDLLTNGGELAAGTDADEADSDCDTLSDYDELNPTGGIPVTNPIGANSDDDSFSDSFEIANGTNPDSIAEFPTGDATLPFSDDFEDTAL